MKTTYTYRGWSLELDSTEIYPDDPGAGTPALVVAPDGSAGTYWCVLAEGECGGRIVPKSIYTWLEGREPSVESFMEQFSE